MENKTTNILPEICANHQAIDDIFCATSILNKVAEFGDVYTSSVVQQCSPPVIFTIFEATLTLDYPVTCKKILDIYPLLINDSAIEFCLMSGSAKCFRVLLGMKPGYKYDCQRETPIFAFQHDILQAMIENGIHLSFRLYWLIVSKIPIEKKIDFTLFALQKEIEIKTGSETLWYRSLENGQTVTLGNICYKDDIIQYMLYVEKYLPEHFDYLQKMVLTIYQPYGINDFSFKYHDMLKVCKSVPDTERQFLPHDSVLCPIFGDAFTIQKHLNRKVDIWVFCHLKPTQDLIDYIRDHAHNGYICRIICKMAKNNHMNAADIFALLDTDYDVLLAETPLRHRLKYIQIFHQKISDHSENFWGHFPQDILLSTYFDKGDLSIVLWLLENAPPSHRSKPFMISYYPSCYVPMVEEHKFAEIQDSCWLMMKIYYKCIELGICTDSLKLACVVPAIVTNDPKVYNEIFEDPSYFSTRMARLLAIDTTNKLHYMSPLYSTIALFYGHHEPQFVYRFINKIGISQIKNKVIGFYMIHYKIDIREMSFPMAKSSGRADARSFAYPPYRHLDVVYTWQAVYFSDPNCLDEFVANFCAKNPFSIAYLLTLMFQERDYFLKCLTVADGGSMINDICLRLENHDKMHLDTINMLRIQYPF